MEKQEYFKATDNGNTLFRTRTRPGIEADTLDTNLIDVKELQGKMMQLEAQNEKLKLRLDKLEEKSEIYLDGKQIREALDRDNLYKNRLLGR